MEEEDLTRARNRLAAGRIRAMEKAPYLSTALLSLEPREIIGFNTFAVDQKWIIYYDPKKCLEWTIDEIAAVWLHEISHVIRNHADRFNETGDSAKDAEYFNIAADAAINSDLRDMGVTLPDADKRWYAEANPMYPKWRRNMTAEEMYSIAKKGKGKPQEQDKGKGETQEDPASQDSQDQKSEDDTAEEANSEDSNEQEGSEDNEQEAQDNGEHNEEDNDSEEEGNSNSSDVDKEDSETPEEDPGKNSSGSENDEKFENESSMTADDSGEGDESDSSAEPQEGEGNEPSDENGEGEKDSSDGESSDNSDSSGADNGSEGSSDGSDDASEVSGDDEGKDAHSHEGNCGSGAHGVPQEYEVDDGSGFDPMEAEQMRRQVAQEINDYSERYGSVPGGMLRDAKEILDPKVDWTEELLSQVRKEIATVVGQSDYTYSKPSRRASQTPFILPSMRQAPPPEIVVILDTSGSMKIQEELAQALGEMEELIESAARYSTIGGIRIINCDAGANIPVIVSDLDDFEIIGGGGTDMRVGIQAAAELDPPAGVIITMTDGYTPWPREIPEDNQDALYIALIIDSSKKKGASQQRGWSTTGIPDWMNVIEVQT